MRIFFRKAHLVGHMPFSPFYATSGTGKDFVRLTSFNDYEGGKASNPVISTDGKLMAFQLAKTTDPAGVEYGLLLCRFKNAK